ncbi:MAG: DUF2182 domain-containing protein [Proteobacteria bacterium]|nr:DUF2182 domain-containing protein [Pseudomonadota bacterium]
MAWWQLWRGAGAGVSTAQMTRWALFPHRAAELMDGMAMPTASPFASLAMWWVMMVAMMTPSALPLVMLHRRVMRKSSGGGASGGVYASAGLVLGYLWVWMGFAVLATAMQWILEQTHLLAQMGMSSRSAWLSAAVLAAAGAYQFSRFKRNCLRHCASPAQFMVEHRRTGRLGPVRLGMHHGAWCVGCCWLLMALLFVVGVMNLIWIAILSALVLLEKLVPDVPMVQRSSGALLFAWSVATLLA